MQKRRGATGGARSHAAVAGLEPSVSLPLARIQAGAGLAPANP